MQAKNLTVSVIIPTFQEEDYIERILSNLRKVATPIEVIVVDGGSNDKTVEIARRFADKVYVIRKRGISRGRNHGANHANGDILVFLDTDVVFPPDFVEKTRKVFEDSRVIGATCNIMPSKFRLDTTIYFYFYNLLMRISTRIKPHSRGEFFAARKSAFMRVNGFDENMPCIEDHDLAIRLSKLGRFVFISKLTVYESLRRIQKLGFRRVLSIWTMDYIFFVLRRKTVSKIWQPVR